MSRMDLSLDAAKLVIGVKGLSGIVENWGLKLDEVIQRHKLIPLLGSVPSNDPQQLMRVPSVSFDLHENLTHRGLGWKIAFLRIIPTSLGTTKVATGSLRHHEG